MQLRQIPKQKSETTMHTTPKFVCWKRHDSLQLCTTEVYGYDLRVIEKNWTEKNILTVIALDLWTYKNNNFLSRVVGRKYDNCNRNAIVMASLVSGTDISEFTYYRGAKLWFSRLHGLLMGLTVYLLNRHHESATYMLLIQGCDSIVFLLSQVE